MKYYKILWRKVENEPLKPGDFWASRNPNEQERQGELNFNLQMQAIVPTCWGRNPSVNDSSTNVGHGAYWRPVEIVQREMTYVPRPVRTDENQVLEEDFSDPKRIMEILQKLTPNQAEAFGNAALEQVGKTNPDSKSLNKGLELTALFLLPTENLFEAYNKAILVS